MQRRLLASMSLVLVLSSLSPASAHVMESSIGITTQIDGVNLQADVPPFLDAAHSRVMVPVRFVAEALGAKVQWDGDHKLVLINTPAPPPGLAAKEGVTIIVNGASLPEAGFLKSDRVFAPVRVLASALRAAVGWDQDSKRVEVTSEAALAAFDSQMNFVQRVQSGAGLPATLAADGTKEFTLVAEPAKWAPVAGVFAEAWTYNGQVPGPTIRVTEGDRVRITLVNHLPVETSIHWHGLHLPNSMDGVGGLTQQPVPPGASFTYAFTASHPGTFMFHPHVSEMEQVGKGLYGALLIDPRDPAAEPAYAHDQTLIISSMRVNSTGDEPDFFLLNGRSYPDTAPITVKKGETVRLRLINIDPVEFHTMHLHGMDFQVVAKDGHFQLNPQRMNTLMIGPGETYDIAFTADAVGTWLFHCHIADHMMGRSSGMGGLVTLIQVTD